jgi:hypothetical protein
VPFCPDDETYLRIVEFVKNGGNLYLSGDVSYDGKTRRRTRTARLIELCGVEFVDERYPDIRSESALPVRVYAATDDLSIDGGAARPAIEVRPAGGTPVVVTEAGDPVAVLNRLGKGWVLFNADPVEIRWRDDDQPYFGDAPLYKWFLDKADVGRLPVTPESPDIRAMRVQTIERGEAWTIFDLSSKETEVRVGTAEEGAAVTLGRNMPGFVSIDGDGRVRSFECGGGFQAGSGTILRAEMPVSVISLDGEDVRRSSALVFVPFSRGQVEFYPEKEWREPLLQVGEVRGGVWRPFETVGLSPGAKGILEFQVRSLQSMEMLLVCEAGEEVEAGETVARRLVEPWRE